MDWFNGLDAHAAAKVVTAQLRMQLGVEREMVFRYWRVCDRLGSGVSDLSRHGWRLTDRTVWWRNETPTAIRHRKGQSPACGIQRQQGSGSGGDQGQAAEEVSEMALTRDFKKTVVARVERDPAFAKELLDEATALLISGEAETARVILRDLVNATLGFERLAKLTDVPSKSLHRMLSPKGNPSMDNLAAIFGAVSNKISRSARATRQRMVA